MRKLKLLTLAALLSVGLTGCFDYSDGDRVGQIIKFSRKGLFCKTWEGEMLLGGLKTKTTSTTDSNGYVSTSTSNVANVFQFTVERPELVPIIKDALDSGHTVRLTYRQELATFCRSDGTDSFITAVKVLN